MPKFFGSYTYKVDGKGRVNIPAPFRTELPKLPKFYITTGPNYCLSLFPKKVFENMTMDIKQECGSYLSPNEKRRDFLKMMDNARICQWDNQGRIIVPRELLQKANITSDVKIIGAVDIIELWNPQIFDEFISKDESSAN